MINCLGSEAVGIVGVVDPDVLTAADHSSGWIDASLFENYLAVVSAGTLGTSATFDAKLEQATDSSGTGAKDISGKAISQMTQAGTNQSDKQGLINLNQADLDIDNGFNHFRLTITVGAASSDGGGLVLGLAARNAPASNSNVSSIDSIDGTAV